MSICNPYKNECFPMPDEFINPYGPSINLESSEFPMPKIESFPIFNERFQPREYIIVEDELVSFVDVAPVQDVPEPALFALLIAAVIVRRFYAH